jgi:diphthine-ammonia ligase
MKAGVLFSGGKDSTYAAYRASRSDELTCLITLAPHDDMSYMFHFPNISWTRLQAESMDVPQILLPTLGVKEEELDDLRRAIESARDDFGIGGVYTGALGSLYQKSRVERVCAEANLRCVSPFWLSEPEAHLRSLLADGFRFMITSVSALGLDESWLGRVVDHEAIDELVKLGRRYKFHIGLEGGEGETFVLDCPLFAKRIEVGETEKHWRGDAGYLEILNARLVPKD